MNFKAFEFPALSEVISEWPRVEDLASVADAEPIYKIAVRYLKKVVLHYQTLQ